MIYCEGIMYLCLLVIICTKAIFVFILLTQKGPREEVYRNLQSRALVGGAKGCMYDSSRPCGDVHGMDSRLGQGERSLKTYFPKGCFDHRFRALPAYTAQLLTLHQHRANNQYRTANQI